LIEAVAGANSNTVVVINNGDPILMPWAKKVKGIVDMWYSGQEGALATVDVLTGKVNPAGRLPVTFPNSVTDTAVRALGHNERYAIPGRAHDKDWVAPNVATFSEGIYMGYRHFDQYGIEPAFEFGYGLSYTRFEYSDLRVETNLDGGLRVLLTVKNVGLVDGEEVVQCYLTCPKIIPVGVQVAPKALTDFRRIAIVVGQKQTVELAVSQQSLCYWKVLIENNRIDDGEGWALLKGRRELLVGASSRDIRLTQTIMV
jgi:beta-glucosidase